MAQPPNDRRETKIRKANVIERDETYIGGKPLRDPLITPYHEPVRGNLIVPDRTGRYVVSGFPTPGSTISPSVRSKRRTRTIVVRDRKKVLQYSRFLIEALQEAVDYNPARDHNKPPPALRIGNDELYLAEVRSLIAELKRLNDALEELKTPNAETQQVALHLAKHFDKFLESYASAMGKGAAVLTIGVVGTYLSYLGVADPLIEKILTIGKHVK